MAEEIAQIIVEAPDMSDRTLDAIIDHARLMGAVLFEYLGQTYQITIEMLDTDGSL